MLNGSSYAVLASGWDNGAAVDAGAAMFFDAGTGVFTSTGQSFSGTLDQNNSFVGTGSGDRIGSEGFLNIGNSAYLRSPDWNGVGAWTWIADPGAGITGTVSVSNSLQGSSPGDLADYFTESLNNNKYAVFFYNWDNGAATDAGAIGIFDRDVGLTGVIGAGNSLVGSHADDRAGTFDPGYVYYPRNTFAKPITDGSRYLLYSPDWNAGAGAITWLDLNDSTTWKGTIASGNSLVGSAAGDRIGLYNTYYGDYQLRSVGNDRYFITSTMWNGNMGAVTWFDGTSAPTGVIGASNSLVGSTAGDLIGDQWLIVGSKYIFLSPEWDNAGTVNAGAITITDATGLTGAVTVANSLVGSHNNDRLGNLYIPAFGSATGIVFRTTAWNSGAGALTWYDGLDAPLTGVLSAANSLVGSTAGDGLGNFYSSLGNNRYAFFTPNWDNGAVVDAGAITIVDAQTPMVGTISSANSLVGEHASDFVGSGGALSLGGSQYLFRSAWWNESRGAISWYDSATMPPLTGPVTENNSMIGAVAGDRIGTSVTSLGGGRALVRSFNATVNGLADAGRLQVFTFPSSAFASSRLFSDSPSASLTISVSDILLTLGAGTNLVLQANNDIVLNEALQVDNALGDGGTLTLQAGRSIFLNANIFTDSGDFNATANSSVAAGVVDAYRDAGDAVIEMAAGTLIDAGSGTITLTIDDGAGLSNAGAGGFNLDHLSGDTVNLVYNAPGSMPLRGTLVLRPGSTTTIGSSVDNSGTINFGAGSTLLINGATLANSGTINLGDDSLLDLSTGNFTNTGMLGGTGGLHVGGSALNSGTFTIADAAANWQVAGNFDNTGALTIGTNSQLLVDGSTIGNSGDWYFARGSRLVAPRPH